MNYLSKYWFLIVFCLGLIGSGYALKAKADTTAEKVEEVKIEVKETKADLKNQEKVDTEQTIALEKLSVLQEQMIRAVDKLNDKIEKK